MAFIKLYRKKLKHNYQLLNKLFEKNSIEWGVVSKLLCGNKLYIKELYDLGLREMHDTRVTNLKAVKQISEEIQTVYIKPVPKRIVSSIIRYADVSFNTEYSTIKLLSKEAKAQKKIHKIIIMVEMGDLREGVMGDQLIDFYAKVFELPNIEIIGLGTNFNCLNGIMPSVEKLVQLCLYKQMIETKFKRKIKWISGGTSVAVPLLLKKQIPKGINHFRIGEALFFGKDIFTDGDIKGMHADVFRLFAEIIELHEKPVVPSGEQMETPSGKKPVFKKSDLGRKTYRAIIDLGLLDCNPQYLITEDPSIELIEASSDMLVLDLGKNSKKYKVGDIVSFQVKYMGVLGLMNSNYIAKQVE